MATCFKKYYNDVSGRPYWTVPDDLDSALELVGCSWKSIFGSGPLYHPVKSFTESEKKEAETLAGKVRECAKIKDNEELIQATLSLSDSCRDFALNCLIARGAAHKGPPKITNQ